MTIWRSKSNSAPTGDPAIHVKYTGLSLSKERTTQATDAMTRARYMVTYVVGRMASLTAANGSPAVTTHAGYYFQLGGAMTQQEFDTIKSVLVQIQNGLSDGVNVKVVNGGGSTVGYVNPHSKLKKTRWTSGTKERDGDGNAITPRTVHRGDIHIGAGRLDKGIKLAAKTIIHEASHKFASTADFGERGYTWNDDGKYREDGLQKDQALSNAESYARFVLHVFDDECGW